MPLESGGLANHNCHCLGTLTAMTTLIQDLKYSFRMLAKSPLFTFVAVFTLALGIGLNAATFSAVHGLLLRPLPGVEAPDRLVQVYRQWPGIEFGSNSIPHYQDVRDRTSEVFEDVASWYISPMSFSADGRSERALGMIVSANFFQTYGVVPEYGRSFLTDIESRDPGAHPVAILGNSFWQARFAGDPDVVGETITLNGLPFQVVGIAPGDFTGPMPAIDSPIYVPLMMQREIQPGIDLIESRGNNMMNVTGRMREGKELPQVRQTMDAMLAQLREEYPDHYDDQVGTTLVLQSEAGIHPSFRNASVGMSGAIMAVVGLLLLIACVNVANLFLARARDRRREMGIRLSLGAGKRRILRQLLTESLVFSLLAGLAGIGLAYFATRLLSQVRPPVDGPFAFDVGLSQTVLWFATGISILTGLIFGLVPALQAARSDMVTAVKGESSQGGGQSRISSALVVAQVALSLVLLVSSGLFLRSLQGATQIDPGFDEPKNLVMASLDPALQGFDQARTQAFYDELRAEVEALPNVSSVGFTNSVPLGFGNSDRGVGIPGYEFAEGERSSLHYSVVTEGYFETMGIDLIEGRTYARRDDENSEAVIIINERFAERFWPGESALGKIVQTAGEDRQVIGVVANGKYSSLGEDPKEFMYLPQRERFRSELTLIARTAADPQAALRGIREIVRGLDPDMPLSDVRAMEDHMGIALLPARLGGMALGLFGVLGLILAAVGIYGVMAYSVAQRRRELGIRVALGADQPKVVRMVLAEGLKLALIGTAVGLAGAYGAGQLVEGLLYNTSAVDPVAFVLVPALLIGVAGLAVLVPALRASRVNPIQVLKVD